MVCGVHGNLSGLVGLRRKRVDSKHVRWTTCRVVDDYLELVWKSVFRRTSFHV